MVWRTDHRDNMLRYWPAVNERKLVPDYSGIRPKLRGPRDAGHAKCSHGGGDDGSKRGDRVGSTDFEIQGAKTHGVTGLVNLLGIESPGLTASLAIANHVAELLEADLS